MMRLFLLVTFLFATVLSVPAENVDERCSSLAPNKTANVDELIDMMNKRKGTTAEYATGDMERYLKAVQAEGSHTMLENGASSIVLRKDVATRHTAIHEWLHRRLQRQNGGPRPNEEAIIENFLNRNKKLFQLEE